MAKQIQIRRDTAANWSSENPVLADGEIGYDSTNEIFKFGDGSTAWNSLSTYTAPIADNSVSPVKLDDEFKTIVALGATVACNWSAGQIFTKTLSAAPTFTFSNLHVGVKFIETTGDYSPTFPTGFTYVGGERAATGTTVYQLICTNASTPVGYYSIYKDES